MNRDRNPAWRPFLRRTALPSFAFLLFSAGCALLPGHEEEAPSPAPCSPPRPPAEYTVESRSVEGRAIRCTVLGSGPRRVLILGGFHGDEPAGPRLCRRLCDELRRRPALLEGRQVLVVPILNPDGRARHSRFNARGVDLNRNFDTSNRRETRTAGPVPLSEPETRFAAALIRVFRPACIVSIHQPLGCVDWDGPARAAAEALSQACGLPVKKLGARPGSLGSFAGVDLGLPTLTLELPAAASDMVEEELWRAYGPALLAAVRFIRKDVGIATTE